MCNLIDDSNGETMVLIFLKHLKYNDLIRRDNQQGFQKCQALLFIYPCLL